VPAEVRHQLRERSGVTAGRETLFADQIEVKMVTPFDRRLSILHHAQTCEHRLIKATHVRDHVHGRHAISRFNQRFAILVTNAVSTMRCAYAMQAAAVPVKGVLTSASSLSPQRR
jgi:hypothetical protein